jgi:hypothetical protein
VLGTLATENPERHRCRRADKCRSGLVRKINARQGVSLTEPNIERLQATTPAVRLTSSTENESTGKTESGRRALDRELRPDRTVRISTKHIRGTIVLRQKLTGGNSDEEKRLGGQKLDQRTSDSKKRLDGKQQSEKNKSLHAQDRNSSRRRTVSEQRRPCG